MSGGFIEGEAKIELCQDCLEQSKTEGRDEWRKAGCGSPGPSVTSLMWCGPGSNILLPDVVAQVHQPPP